MKRSLGSSDSLGALMSICPTTSEDQHNHVYSNEFQSMLLESLDEDGCVEELGHMPEKKRRLKVEQVKALEKNFEVDNKLEPERKVKLAHELGLQPRQVAVWFQNRRARWKTKQLERDYGVLKANYDALKLNYDKIKGNNDALLKEIQEMKGKIEEDEDNENKVVIKEEGSGMVSENENPDPLLVGTSELNFESFNTNNINGGGELMAASVFAHDFKDGSSYSTSDDSSAVLNELDNNNNHSSIDHHHFLISNDSSSSSRFQFSESTSKTILEEAQTAYQPQFVKIEEHNFFSGEDSCNTFFCDDQAPTLHWYNSNEWT